MIYGIIMITKLTKISMLGWDKDAIKFLKEIARVSSRRWGKSDSLGIKFFFQRLSITLQRGNAALLANRDYDSTSYTF